MHELSIADAVWRIARAAAPPRTILRSVRLVAGPMRGIEPEAMQFAWSAVTADAGFDEVSLHLDLRPWTLRCPDCGREWTSDQLDYACVVCGDGLAYPAGGDELTVVSIEVDDEPQPKGAASCVPCTSSKT